MLGRGARRWSVVLALGISPVAAIAWMGCGDDDATVASGLGKPDPGGTWGAQIAVSVVGRGNVSAGSGAIDCPSTCFKTVVFKTNGEDGAIGGLTLTATPPAGGQFLGWSFEPATLGGVGRGSDLCNPVSRPTSLVSGDLSAPTITLPYGETDGTSPVGREGQCDPASRKVPLAYKVIATFSGDLPEAGPDANDGGDGGNSDPVVYTNATASSATVLGRTSSGYLYWLTDNGTPSLNVGLSPESSPLPQTSTTLSGALDSISKIKVEPTGVVLLDIFGDLKVVRQSSPTSLLTVGSTSSLGTCQAIAMDSNSNVHCRLSTSIATWKWNGASYASTPTQVYVDLPSGSDLAVDTSNFYYSTSSTIEALPLNGTDASAPTQIITSTFSVSKLVAGTSKLTWLSGSTVELSTDKLSSSPFSATGISTALTGTIFNIAFDPFDSFTVYAGGSSAIYRYEGAGSPTLVKNGKFFTGMAVGSTYVLYSVSGDNRIYRVAK